ncbi:ABC-type transport auxiliary lipoprotein family protein [Pseudomonas sp. LRF_L74]|uniref:ABC-type transport auxiliary lipoprotein family protein n=1 Tax=Pseudomonas sp. LRF_L74 TaxID=3369422 RepID=UPI003F5E8321
MKRLLLGAMLVLGGCSVLPKSEPLDVYLLPGQTRPAVATHQATAQWSLRVSKPQSSLLLDSTRIAVVPDGDRIAAYQGARWADRAPALLRDRLLDVLLVDGRIASVSSDDNRLQADVELAGDLRAFQSEYRDGAPAAHILYDAKLVREGRIVASRRFDISENASDTSVSSVVEAFGRAADRLAEDAAHWVWEQGGTL